MKPQLRILWLEVRLRVASISMRLVFEEPEFLSIKHYEALVVLKVKDHEGHAVDAGQIACGT